MSITKEDLKYLRYSKSFQESEDIEPPKRAKFQDRYFVEFYLSDGSLETYDILEFQTFYPTPDKKDTQTSVHLKNGKSYLSHIPYPEFAHQFFEALKCDT